MDTYIQNMIKRAIIVFTLTLNLPQISLADKHLSPMKALNHSKGYKYENIEDTLAEMRKKFPVVNDVEGATEFKTTEDIKTRFLSNGGYGPIPEEFDWSKLNLVSPVRNQRGCAACWAFSVIGVIESHAAIYTGRRLTLSEQFLIDCFRDDNGNFVHCGDYSVLQAYRKITTEYGVIREHDYGPYLAHPKSCHYTTAPISAIPIIGFARVFNDEVEIARHVYFYGPLSAALNSKSMERYKGNGVDMPSEKNCSSDPRALDHAVMIVGYSVYTRNNQKIPYWIIRNSWGDHFGSMGYYLLIRGVNACGIANDVSYPILSK